MSGLIIDPNRRELVRVGPERRPDVAHPSTALVIIPGAVNYFYNLNGRRIAEALSELGFVVAVHDLQGAPERPFDLAVVAAPSEVLAGATNEAVGWQRLDAIRRRCGFVVASSIEAVGTSWFDMVANCCDRLHIDEFWDFGFHDQSGKLAGKLRKKYKFILNGLTRSERTMVEAMNLEDEMRPIPWAFVGHLSPERARLIDLLVRTVSPEGFAYIPDLTGPCKEKGSAHLNEEQFLRVLRRSRYQIWCSQHPCFYMESERFRMSLLSGSVPVKVLTEPRPADFAVPLDYLLMDVSGLGEHLSAWEFKEVRCRFRRDFLEIPPLEQTIQRYLTTAGMPGGGHSVSVRME